MRRLRATALALALGALGGCGTGADRAPATVTSTEVAPSRPAPSVPTTGPAERVPRALTDDLARVRRAHPRAVVTVAFAPVGRPRTPTVVGTDPGLPAWSTMKVPIVLAALRTPSRGSDQVLRRDADAAITASDNDAAAELWSSLGPPPRAARRTEAVLRGAGDRRTRVESRVLVPGFSAFGQTRWAVADQARFTSGLPCLADADEVLPLMGRVRTDQRWGLGTVRRARFKGGWGPTPQGYVARQLGIVPARGGRTAVALAVRLPGGTHEEATAILGDLARVLTDHRTDLPSGTCPS